MEYVKLLLAVMMQRARSVLTSGHSCMKLGSAKKVLNVSGFNSIISNISKISRALPRLDLL